MRRTRLIVVAVIVIAAVGAGLAWRNWPVAVQTAAATRGPAIDAVYATGSVEPTVMLPVAPRTGGRLAALSVDEGARVKRGQVLARLEAPDLDSTVQEMAPANNSRAAISSAPRIWSPSISSPRPNSTAPVPNSTPPRPRRGAPRRNAITT